MRKLRPRVTPAARAIIQRAATSGRTPVALITAPMATDGPGGKWERGATVSREAQEAMGTLRPFPRARDLPASIYSTESAWAPGRKAELLISRTARAPNARTPAARR